VGGILTPLSSHFQRHARWVLQTRFHCDINLTTGTARMSTECTFLRYDEVLIRCGWDDSSKRTEATTWLLSR